MNAFVIERVPLLQSEIDQVNTTLASPGFKLIREMLAAIACEAVLKFADASLYPTEVAQLSAEESRIAARRFNDTVEVLDRLAENADDWFRIKLDQRR